MRTKLRTRVTTSFVLIVLVVTSLATASAVSEGRAEIERSITDNQRLANQNAVNGLRGFLESAERLLAATASRLRTDDVHPTMDERTLGDIFDPVVAFAQMFSALVVVDVEGKGMSARPPAGPTEYLFHHEPAFLEVAEGAEKAIAFVSPEYGPFWVVPIPDTVRGGTPYMLVGILRMDPFEEALFSNLPPQTDGLLRDGAGQVIIATDALPGNTSDRGRAGNVRADAALGAWAENGAIVTTEPLGLVDGDIVLLGSGALIKTLEARLVRNALFTAAILAAGAIIVGLYLSRVVAMPLRRLEKATHEMADGRLHTRVISTGAHEFRLLADSFNKMADRLERSRASLLALQVDLERKVEERTEELARRQADMEMFFYATTHDLKNPAIAVGSLVDFMREDMGRPEGLTKADLRDYIERIDRSASSMEGLIHQILQFAKIERDKPAYSRFDLAVLVASVVDGSRDPARQKGIRILTDGRTLEMVSDRDRIEHILMNLVGNAVKYMDERPESHIVVKWRRVGGATLLEVSDNGPGIPQEQLGNIFRPFKRTATARTLSTGSGLGLHIVHRLVESLGGQIGIDSGAGRGARFTIRLPAAPAGATDVVQRTS